MEGIAVNAYQNVKRLCRTRGYTRLNRRRLRTTTDIRSATDPTNLHRRPKRRLWRIKISPKLRTMFVSPKKLLAKLRDAYVNFMLHLASSPLVSGAGGGYGAVDYGVRGFGMRPVNKDYDEKVIIEIYKSLVRAREQLAVRDAAENNSHGISAPPV